MLIILLPADSLWSMNSSPFTTVSLSSTGDNRGGNHTLHSPSTVSLGWFICLEVNVRMCSIMVIYKRHWHWMPPEFMKNRWSKFLFHETTIPHMHSYTFVFPWSRNVKHGWAFETLMSLFLTLIKKRYNLLMYSFIIYALHFKCGIPKRYCLESALIYWTLYDQMNTWL